MANGSLLARTRRFVLLCATSAMDIECVEAARTLLHEGISVPDLFEIGAKHKILQLVTPNLLRVDTENLIAWQWKRLLITLHTANRERNKALFAEADVILRAFEEAGLAVLPLKGMHLAQDMYHDAGSRTMNDLDLLIRREDRQAVSDAIRGIGYIVGDVDPVTGVVHEASRKDVVKWSMYVGNLHKHVKRLGTPFAEYCRVDFSYDATGAGDFALTDHLFAGAVDEHCGPTPTRMLNRIDFFLHIALHLHKEAVNEKWLRAGSEQHLIKYCDLREYLRKWGSECTPDEVAARAERIGARGALEYAVPRLLRLFPDACVTEFAAGLDEWATVSGRALMTSAAGIADGDPAIREWVGRSS